MAGGPTREIQCSREAPTAARLEKRGDYVLLLLAYESGRFEPTPCSIKLPLVGQFYAGLAVCAHDNAAFEVAKFSFVSLGLLPPRAKKRMSAIEVIALDSLQRRVVYQSDTSLDSPSFTAVGNAVCFREGGQLNYFSLTANSDSHMVGAENVDECRLAAFAPSPWQVSHKIKDGRAQLFRGDGEKPQPQQLTEDSYSNWMPRLSPDGQWIAFVSGLGPPQKDKPVPGDYLLRELPIGGGKPRELAQFFGGPGALGLSPWSADGKRLVFVTREPD
jgi:TolB protein